VKVMCLLLVSLMAVLLITELTSRKRAIVTSLSIHSVVRKSILRWFGHVYHCYHLHNTDLLCRNTVAEMGDNLSTRGCCAPFGGRAWSHSPSNTMWPGSRPTSVRFPWRATCPPWEAAILRGGGEGGPL